MASINADTLIVKVVLNDDTLTLTSAITFPPDSIEGPHPIINGIDRPTGSLSSDMFTKRNIATMPFNSA